MKKLLIASIIGAIILFVWGAMAWTFLPIHHHTFKYSPAQEQVLEHLSENLGESGAYGMPSADNREISMFDSNYMTETEKIMKENAGKPSAIIFYNDGGNVMSGRTYAFGFLFQFILAFIASLMLALTGDRLKTFFDRWWLVMLLAVFVSIEGHLMSWNWMGFSWHYVKDMILDELLAWAIVGIWLAYYFGRGKTAAA